MKNNKSRLFIDIFMNRIGLFHKSKGGIHSSR